ncbi:MAG: TIGR02391 family protein [Candidatus Hydromicrobium sp.]
MAPKNFDRPINQATLVLEDRIRNKAQPSPKLVGENLINYAFNEDLSKTMLQVASKDTDDQRGFTQILRGVVHMFRNKTHHHITASFSREDAIRVCGFIDVLLRVVDKSVKVK